MRSVRVTVGLLVAAYIRKYSGLGFSPVLVAGLAFVIDPIAAVPLAITFDVSASIVQGHSARSEITCRDFRLLLGAAIVSNPIGGLAALVESSERRERGVRSRAVRRVRANALPARRALTAPS